MVTIFGPGNRYAFCQAFSLISILILVPLLLSTHRYGALLAFLFLVVFFCLPGYLLLALMKGPRGALRFLLSPIIGILVITTTYDILAGTVVAAYFPYAVIMLSFGGLTVFLLQTRRDFSLWVASGYESLIAGSVVALSVAPLLWRSGRVSGSEFVFYGPAGQDHLYHVSLLQRLLLHVPPDNFMMAGLRAPVYHYFDDLTLGVLLRAQAAFHLGPTDLFDLYYRCYPTLVYFLIGAFAYRIGRTLLGSVRGGVLSVLLLLGAGGLGLFLGALQTAVRVGHFASMRAALFSDWSSWDGVDAIRPLVHRPAHYHGLMICLAVICVLLPRDRSRRHWILSGLALGMMAGFNFTLAATFGIAALLGSLILFLKRQRSEARDLIWVALFIFIGSLPVTAAMMLSGFHSVSAGFPFNGPNLEFPAAIWGTLLGRLLPTALISWFALIVLPIVAYGVKGAGISPMVQLDLGEEHRRGIAMLFVLVFVLSFVTGMFFPYRGVGGIAIVFLQPTFWILGLFALRPIDRWIERNRGTWRTIGLWGMLGLTWVQALIAFNFCDKAAFGLDTAQAFHDIRLQAASNDVIAYLPNELTEGAILGRMETSTNYSITAMTGLDGYFSSETYSISFAVPGVSGSTPAEVYAEAERLYRQRRDDIASFVKGSLTEAASDRLAKDHVRWIVVSGDALRNNLSLATPWRKTPDIAIYHFDR